MTSNDLKPLAELTDDSKPLVEPTDDLKPLAELTAASRPLAGPRYRWLRTWLPFAGVVLAAFALRFYRLADMPPGLHYDEAFDALDAHALLSLPLRSWPIFFTGNFGREPLFMYLLAISERLFGPTVLALHLVTALVGALMAPALAWLAWEMAPFLRAAPRRLALWAGLATLTLLWGQIFARYAIRVELYPLVEVLFLAAAWRAWRTNRHGWWAAAGVLAGLCFYTYLPARLLPLAFVPVVPALWRRRRALAGRGRGLVLAGLLAAAVLAPLGTYFLRNPATFSTRVDQVSVLGRGVGTILDNVRLVLGMALGPGDANPRNNLPGRPALDALTALPFLAGLAYLIWRWKWPAASFTLTWLLAMLLPTMLSEYAPSFQRGIGALPTFALLIAIGLDRLVAWAASRLPGWRPGLEGAGWVLLGASVIITWQAFQAWDVDPALFYARDVGFAQLAGWLAAPQGQRATDPGGVVYISPRGFDHPSIRYLLLQDPTPPVLRGFDGRICVRIPGGIATHYLFITAEDFRGPGIQKYLPDSTERTLVLDGTGKPWAVEVQQPANGRVQFPEMVADPARLDDGIQLMGYWLSGLTPRPGDLVYVRLFWRAAGRPHQDYTTFVHLSATGPGGGAQYVAGVDAQPGAGTCRTSDWQPGEMIVDELQLQLPKDLPGASYALTVGFYNLSTGQRLRVAGQAGDQIPLREISVHP